VNNEPSFHDRDGDGRLRERATYPAMTNASRIALVRNYDGLVEALRKRADELQVSRLQIDAMSGLPDGYAAKILAPVQVRALGRISLGPMLQAMGLALLVVEDVETLDRLNRRLVKLQKRRHADDSMPTIKRHKRRGFWRSSEWGRIMRSRAFANQSAPQRSRLARHASRCRWAKPAVCARDALPLKADIH
jgi:hypothetical protein